MHDDAQHERGERLPAPLFRRTFLGVSTATGATAVLKPGELLARQRP
ncbi:twin-arginine translocation signal domain-containing protein [Halomonas sp. MCCC 1A11036]|uniref:Twin-arginine translocation signal domain-containing protein n=1 Tax=Billgrantia zhangzhouensis TaxID=2733481 RepID=A0ABS9AIS3_9GAMM|nr:twin-arginine translocation signal domain-containing protein [Halomonas zhangzhouensis]MCE8021665.1 twin-arginine translocation signal domain-containing protein [Halomonas zhangzhouensis]